MKFKNPPGGKFPGFLLERFVFSVAMCDFNLERLFLIRPITKFKSSPSVLWDRHELISRLILRGGTLTASVMSQAHILTKFVGFIFFKFVNGIAFEAAFPKSGKWSCARVRSAFFTIVVTVAYNCTDAVIAVEIDK
jgi:hypothetical protein